MSARRTNVGRAWACRVSRRGRLASVSAPPRPRAVQSWKSAEENAAAWMRHWGYRDARVTAPGADKGVDVRASKALAQVKYEAAHVGRPALQRLVGARGRLDRELFFFSGAGYTNAAQEYAREMGLALFVYDLAGGMKPVSAEARRIVQAAKREARTQTDGSAEASGASGRAARARPSVWRLVRWYAGLYFWAGIVYGFVVQWPPPPGTVARLVAFAVLATFLSRSALRKVRTARRTREGPPASASAKDAGQGAGSGGTEQAST
jgi:hypothetical protein